MRSNTTGKLIPSQHLQRTAIILSVAWTAVIALICAWNLWEQRQNINDMAYIEAKQAIKQDLAYRLWAAKQGGVYVPVTDETPPNPYLADIKRRDVTTTDGQQLTLINPAYMTRQVHELGQQSFGLHGHLTSLDPIRPENAPDVWEAAALKAFERGVPEIFEVTRIENADYLRLIMPMRTEEPCLKCHAKQGNQRGDLRGGISAAIPLEPLRESSHQHMVNIVLGYALLCLIGLLGSNRAFWHIRQRIRKREQVEQFLMKNEKNLRITLNSIGDGVVATDLNGLVTQLNPIAEKLTGWRSRNAKGRPLTEVFCISPPQSRQSATGSTEYILGAGETPELVRDVMLTSCHGTRYSIAFSSAPIMDTDGEISGRVLVFRDVSEQVRLQEELLRSRKLEAIAILAGGLAHDFNNLFTGLFGNIQLAMMKLDKDHPAYSRLVAATQSFEIGTNLTQQLLTFAKGGHPLLEETDLGQVIQSAIKLSLTGENIKVVQTMSEDLWHIRGDHGQLSQVFNNLFINSVQAMPDGGTLHIDAQNIKGIRLDSAPELSGDFIEICIRDEGQGIPAEVMPKVFDVFYSTKVEGKGLGLAIVHRIIDKHNGHVCLTSEPGVGTTVTIYLPVESSSEMLPAKISMHPHSKANASAGRILVMDDEVIIRDLSKEMLESCGHQVDTAADGAEALEKYISADQNGKPFDAVLMDLNVPGGMGGKTAIKKLLALYPEAKVIVISGYFSDAVMADFSSYGFKGRLAKPFQVEVLQNELSRVMNL